MIKLALTPAVFLVAALSAAPGAFSQEAVTAKIAGPAAGVIGGAVVVRATVESVNQETREVVLKSESGEVLDFVAGPEVRNLAQVNTGDIVEVEYFEAVALELQEERVGIRERVESTEATRAEPGENPAASTTRRIEGLATVVGVDRENRLVVLKGPTQTVTVKVGDQVDLERIEEGDEVKATYIEEIAIAVRSPK
jgi:Cu/Ag efflux protein CusF